jgi:hypothetical protein
MNRSGGSVDGILISFLVQSICVCKVQYLCILGALAVFIMAKRNLVLCECTCLVAAENSHTAKVLDRVESFDNGPLFGKSEGTTSQIGVDNRWKHLWHDANCDRNAKYSGLAPILGEETLDTEHSGDHNDHESSHHIGYMPNATLEGTGRHPLVELLRNRRNKRVVSGSKNECSVDAHRKDQVSRKLATIVELRTIPEPSTIHIGKGVALGAQVATLVYI